MPTRKTATKTSSKASLNINIDKNSQNKIKKSIKGKGAKALFLAFVFFLIGIGGGIGAWYIVCKDDCFYLLGQEDVVLTLNEKYTDEGVKIIAFGKDDSKNYEIETNLLIDDYGNYYSNEVGTFYIKYISKNLKYNTFFKVQKVRCITFVENSEGGQ